MLCCFGYYVVFFLGIGELCGCWCFGYFLMILYLCVCVIFFEFFWKDKVILCRRFVYFV